MAIVINGTGSIAGLSVGGLPDDSVDEGSLANSINTSIGAKLPLAGGTVTGDVNFGDNVDANFGADADLKIYHDGSNSYIDDVGTGNLLIKAQNLKLLGSNNDNILFGQQGGGVTLYHSNAAKFATSSAGGTLTGDLTVTDDLILNSDSAAITWGADGEYSLFHTNDTGLTLKSNATGDDTFPILNLITGQTDIDDNDYIGMISFQAPDEGTGTDAILPVARMYARAEADFSASVNKTKLVFATSSSSAPVDRMVITHDGRVISDSNAFAWCTIGLDNVAAGNANPGLALNISTVTLHGTGVARFNYTNASGSNQVAGVTTHNTAGGTANYNNSTSSYIQFTYYHSNGSEENASGVNMVSFGGN